MMYICMRLTESAVDPSTFRLLQSPASTELFTSVSFHRHLLNAGDAGLLQQDGRD